MAEPLCRWCGTWPQQPGDPWCWYCERYWRYMGIRRTQHVREYREAMK